MRRIFEWSIRLKPSAVGFYTGMAVMLTVIAVAFTLYRTSLEAIRKEVEGDLIRSAQVAAAMIDGDTHKQFISRSQESSQAYAEAIRPLASVLDSSSDISFVYTLVRDEKGSVRFVLDPTEAGDEDKDGVDDKSHIMQLYPEVTDTAIQALKERRPMAESTPTEDAWGTWISGYAPFYDSEGRFVGVVGIDLKASDYLERLAGVHQAGLLGLMVGAILAICIGSFASLSHKRMLEDKHEILTRERELEATAKSLEASISAEQAAREQMRVASQRFQLLFNELPVACFTYDHEGVISEWNEQFEELFELEAEEVFLKPVDNVFPAISRPLWSVISGPALHDHEWSFTRRDGRTLTLITSAFAIEMGDRSVGGISSILDISDRKELEDELEEKLRLLEIINKQLETLSITDGLTGIHNRRCMEDDLAKLFTLSRRTHDDLSILLLDVDKFKLFNDSFGHQAGDEVLKKVAKTLQSVARDSDIVARYGGEEFCVILPATDREGALIAAERYRKAIEAENWDHRQVTASFGAATLTDHMNGDELLKDADLALYAAKEAGRNRSMHVADLPHREAA